MLDLLWVIFLVVDIFTGINPLGVHIDRLGEVVYGGAKVLQTDSARNLACIPLTVQLYFTTFLMITERTVEQSVQRLDGLLRGDRRTLTLLLCHLSLLDWLSSQRQGSVQKPKRNWVNQTELKHKDLSLYLL